MGYNKVILCLNDAEENVTNDTIGWWRRSKEAFLALYQQARPGGGEKTPVTFGHGNHANGWAAVWEEHADITAVIMVGGNHATIMGSTLMSGHHTKEGQIAILKDILDDMGYTVTKKRVRK